MSRQSDLVSALDRRSGLRQITYFTVRGRGEFPWQMLAYDMCFPASDEDVRKIMPRYDAADPRETLKLRDVRLGCASRTGPTVARWESFTWPALPLPAIDGVEEG